MTDAADGSADPAAVWRGRVQDHLDAAGRPPLGAMAGWEVFPFEREGLRVRPLEEYAVPEPDRRKAPEDCKTCTALGRDDLVLHRGTRLGVIRPGALADLVIVPLNPVQDFKVLYGTGTLRLDEQGEVARVGGVRWTIKDGIVYDAPALLRDVADMVERARRGTATEAGSR